MSTCKACRYWKRGSDDCRCGAGVSVYGMKPIEVFKCGEWEKEFVPAFYEFKAIVQRASFPNSLTAQTCIRIPDDFEGYEVQVHIEPIVNK